jgi:inner membrane protein
MDPITHAIVGGCIGQVCFRRSLGKQAIIFGACCAALPDLDMLLRLAGPWVGLMHHRGITHSLFALLLLTPLLGWIGYVWTHRQACYLTWCHLVFWSVLSHSLLDVCTAYGTQFLAPFSDKRFAIDAMPILDPFYTLPLLAVLLVGCSHRVSEKFQHLFGVVMLVLTTCYAGLGYIQSGRAAEIASAQLRKESFSPVQIRAMPGILNIWLWRVVAKDAHGNLQIGMVSTLSPQEIQFEEVRWPKHPLVEKTLETAHGKIFQWFSMDMVSVRVEAVENITNVYLQDQRYGLIAIPTKTIFSACARWNHKGELIEMRLLPPTTKMDIIVELRRMWSLLWGRP